MRDLALVYTLVGADCIDVAAEEAVIEAARWVDNNNSNAQIPTTSPSVHLGAEAKGGRCSRQRLVAVVVAFFRGRLFAARYDRSTSGCAAPPAPSPLTRLACFLAAAAVSGDVRAACT